MKIAFGEVPFSNTQIEALERIAQAAGHETCRFGQAAHVTPEALEGYDAVLGFFSAESLKGLKSLRWVQVPSAGVDHLTDVLRFNHGTILTNSSGAYGITISEYMMAGILMMYRRMPAYMRNQKAHIWGESDSARTINGSVVTIAGLGDLGRNFAQKNACDGRNGTGRTAQRGNKTGLCRSAFSR